MADGNKITGANGAFKYGNAVLGSATNLPIINVNVREKISGVLDTSDSATVGGYKEKKAGKFKEWSGDCESLVTEGQAELVVGNEYPIHIVEMDDSGNERYWSGNAIITEIGRSIPVVADDMVKRSISFEGNGALTKTEN